MEKSGKKATQLLYRKWIANQKQGVCEEIHASGENLEAVATFKQYWGRKDSPLIYKVNDWCKNPDRLSFLLKQMRSK